MVNAEREKQIAAEAAADLVEDRMTIGLGTGSTVAFLLPALARRSLDIHCVATSPQTERAAHELGLMVMEFNTVDRVDITIDGADQIAPDGWLVKGGGAAHPREDRSRRGGPLRRHRGLVQAGRRVTDRSRLSCSSSGFAPRCAGLSSMPESSIMACSRRRWP
jgi:hypothetical protein